MHAHAHTRTCVVCGGTYPIHVAGQFTPKDYGQYKREGIQITAWGRWLSDQAPQGTQAPCTPHHTCTMSARIIMYMCSMYICALLYSNLIPLVLIG